MQNWRDVFLLSRAELRLSDPSDFTAPQADILEILLDKSLLRIEQFQVAAEKGISADEQIVWHINASLPQPIENYYYAYQIYLQNAEYLQGLFCAIEKDRLSALTVLSGRNIYIYSADRQFLLYKNILPFWQIVPYLDRLLAIAKWSCLSVFIFALLVCPALFWLRSQLFAQNSSLLREKELLSGRLTKARASERRQKIIQANKALNKKLSAYLYAVNLNLPEQAYFSKLTYLEKEITIDGFCAQDKDLKALQKALKTEPGLKPELAKLQKTDRINFSLRVGLQKMLEKE